MLIATPLHAAEVTDAAREANAAESVDASIDSPADEPAEAAGDDSDSDLTQRLVAGAVVMGPTMIAGALAAYIFPLGLGIAIAPVIAVVLPATAATAASFFVVPWYWAWAPGLAAFGGTVVGAVAGIVVGLVLVNSIPPAWGVLYDESNQFFLLPAMAISTAVGSGLAGAAAAFVVGGAVDPE
jgi:hypothetical protein